VADWTALASGDDLSVNFGLSAGDAWLWEARSVRRRAACAVVCLSSQSTGRQACRMCHLMATGQAKERGAMPENCLAQAEVARAHLDVIAGENDSKAEVAAMLAEVRAAGLVGSCAQARFHPPIAPGACERSQEVLAARFRALAEGPAGPSSRQVPRVGFDVRASCGMFVEGPAARRRAA
jgi:hypothetical protein